LELPQTIPQELSTVTNSRCMAFLGSLVIKQARFLSAITTAAALLKTIKWCAR
jgi:hypothetical protein